MLKLLYEKRHHKKREEGLQTEEVFAICTVKKGLVFGIYRKSLKIKNKKISQYANSKRYE